jgi:cell division protein FtsL
MGFVFLSYHFYLSLEWVINMKFLFVSCLCYCQGITLVMSAIMILLAVCMFFAALRLDHMQWKQRMLASEQQRIDCEEEEIDTVDEILNERYGFSPPSPSRCKYGSVS